jgi:tetratricopeptide (TPR) repeat protein
MSPRFCLSITVGAGMLLAATPSFASLTWPTNDLAAQGAVKHCADAAAVAIAERNVTDADVAKCTKAIELAGFKGDRAAALSNRSALHFQRANYSAAVADSTAALELDRGRVEALVNRGASYLKLQRPGDAEANFSRALRLSPAHAARIHFNRAMAREDMGDRNGAYADYARASQLAPQWDQPKQQLMRFTIIRGKPMS